MGESTSPILSAATGARPEELWLGGVGGVVSIGAAGMADRSGAPGPSGPSGTADESVVDGPLTCVAALGIGAGRLLAGGAEGIARRTEDAWDLAQVQGSGAPVVAFLDVRSENSEDEQVVLAATLGDGVLRSVDAGRTWQPVFGLADTEVTALVRTSGGRLLAGTPEGVFASDNAGRAWRRTGRAVPDGSTFDVPVAAFTPSVHDSVVAGLESGEVWCSADEGRTWSPLGSLPAPVTALVTTAAGTLLAGTSGAGLWRCADGTRWQESVPPSGPAESGTVPGRVSGAAPGTVHCLLADGTTAYAGTADGLLISHDDGRTWSVVGVPSTADLDRLVCWDGRPLLAGPRSGIVLGDLPGNLPGTNQPVAAPNDRESLADVPFPLLGLGVAPDGALLVSGTDGLLRRTPTDPDWTPVVEGSTGAVGRLAFAADGRGWAAPAGHGDALLHSADAGRSWQQRPAPFGTFPLTALGWVGGDDLVAATFDHRRNLVTVFGSADGGRTWREQLTAETAWPRVHVARAGADGPVALAVGRMVLRRGGDGGWAELTTFETGVRAMTATPTGLAVLTGDGLWTYDLDTDFSADNSTDLSNDTDWRRVEDGPDPASVYDLAGRGDELLVLLAGGDVWTSIPTRRGR